MTIREAIDEMKFGIDENESTGFYNVQTEAYKMAIEALEKQIPKKVVRIHSKCGSRYYDTFLCPSCGESAETDCGDPYENYGLDWCNNCGQKLDWSEE